MLKKIYSIGFSYPKLVIGIITVLTVFFALQLDGLRWETDARVYLPKGHDAILYDEKVDELFGVKDTLIISIVNEEQGIYNPETLERIARISKKVSELPGVISITDTDVVSIATATVFEGDDDSMGSRLVMPQVPQTPRQMAALQQTIEDHKDILVGNIVSEDGTAAMIRMKIKEGAQHRYMTYFQVKGILAVEKGENPTWGPWGGDDSDGEWGGNEWVNPDGTLKDKSSDSEKDEEWSGNKWVNADGSPKSEAQQTTKEEPEWKGNKWVNEDGSAVKTTAERDPDFAGNKWVNTDGTPKPAAQQVVREEPDWEGNQWLNPDGSPKQDNETADPNFAGNKWVNTDGSLKPAAKKQEVEDPDWVGNKWVSADGKLTIDLSDADPDFAGNKWVNTDGSPKPAAQSEVAEEEGWSGNQWVNADGTPKHNPDEPDPDFAGNKWVKADGTPKPAAQTEVVEEEGWAGNQWVNADGSPKLNPEEPDPDFAGNKWVKADGSPKPAAKAEEIKEEGWSGNKWVNPDGSPKSTTEEAETDFVGNKWVNPDGTPKQVANPSEPEEEGWSGNKWVNADGTPKKDVASESSEASTDKSIKDEFYISGRPAIEVSSGLYAMEDMQLMIPLLIAAMALVLLIIFRTWRGMLLPLAVMSISIIWTFGLMVLLDIPLYTISTMLPVILVAVGIGDGVHLLSSYYNKVLHNPESDAKSIVSDATLQLGPPLVMTSVTTAIGFLALMFAEMPPFKIFGIFALVGILLSWFVTITLLPAVLTLLKPKVGNYLAKRRALRVYEEKDRLSLFLTNTGRWIEAHRKPVFAGLVVLIAVSLFGASKLYVNSSWMSDFRADTDIAQANAVVNDKFSGSIFLNVVIEAEKQDAFKNPELLSKMEALQEYVETLPYVGDSISVVDYIKSMNKELHAGDEQYHVLPDSQAQIAEYLFLFSVSGRPQQLDEVVDFGYQTGLITVIIQTDHTKELKHIIDSVNSYVDKEFQGLGVDVNLSGSGNNSFVWAKLLIDSQSTAIVLSKVAILFVAGLVFASLIAGVYVVIPVTLSTLFVAGAAGLMSIPLDVSTALAAGIAIGVGVDYAIHFIYRYIQQRKAGEEHLMAMEHTLRTTGHTIVLNAVVVSVGFAVLFFSQFPPHVKLGYFVTAYMIVSCIVAIWVLPALISYFKPSFARQEKT